MQDPDAQTDQDAQTDLSEQTDLDEVLAVLEVLRSADCRAWVSGGWGVDALVGRQTRPHRDLDLAIEHAGLESGLRALAGLGYAVETDWLPVRVEVHRPGRGRVDLHPIVLDQRGDGVQAGFGTETFHYPVHDFVTGSLNGTAVECLSGELQLTFRRGYVLREVDHHDLALLGGLPDRSGADSDVNLGLSEGG